MLTVTVVICTVDSVRIMIIVTLFLTIMQVKFKQFLS